MELRNISYEEIGFFVVYIFPTQEAIFLMNLHQKIDIYHFMFIPVNFSI